MNIKFYKTKDPLNKIDKTITNELSKTGKLLEDCSIIRPRITVAFNPVAYNYAYIPDFGRYYFISEIINKTNDLWEVSLKVDPLKSFASEIKASPCVVAKSSDRYNLFINDPNYKCEQDNIYLINRFPGGFDLYESMFILTCFCNVDYTS